MVVVTSSGSSMLMGLQGQEVRGAIEALLWLDDNQQTNRQFHGGFYIGNAGMSHWVGGVCRTTLGPSQINLSPTDQSQKLWQISSCTKSHKGVIAGLLQHAG
jgi:hypothetical protein